MKFTNELELETSSGNAYSTEVTFEVVGRCPEILSFKIKNSDEELVGKEHEEYDEIVDLLYDSDLEFEDHHSDFEFVDSYVNDFLGSER